MPQPIFPPVDNATAAQRWIDTSLSTRAPAGSLFPAEVLPGHKLDFANLRQAIDALSAQLRTLLPEDRATAETLHAIRDIPTRLNVKVQHWHADHRRDTDPRIPSDQFNLLVADEFRRASKLAGQLAHDRHATPHQRLVAAELEPLLNGLKRVHYANTVQELYRASGVRALPVIAEHGAAIRPGFNWSRSAGIGIEGGVGIDISNLASADITVPLGYRRELTVSVAPDGDLLVGRTRQLATGITAGVDLGIGPCHKLATARTGVKAQLETGDQIKATGAEQAYKIYGSSRKYDTPLWTSASPRRRGLTSAVASVGNFVAQALGRQGAVFDKLEPVHANARKQMKGAHVEALIHDHARALDQLAASSARRDPDQPERRDQPGPIERAIAAAWPSTAQRIAAMDDPTRWTASQIKTNLPGLDDTNYGRMGRNARGRATRMHAPLKNVGVTPFARLAVGLTETYGDTDTGPRAMLPSVSVDVGLPTIHDTTVNHQMRLASVVDLMNIGQVQDFAPVLSQLQAMKRHYAKAYPGGETPPHLVLLERYDAMKQSTLMLPARPEAASKSSPSPSLGDGIYGDVRQMPGEFRVAIMAMRSGTLRPAELLHDIDSNLRMFAIQDARFKTDASEAWARRGTAEGESRLRQMNRQYFDDRSPLAASSHKPLKDADYTAFFGRAYDAHAMALCNLGAQRSVALREGAMLLASSGPEEQARFQAIADAGAAVYRARVAAHNEHNLPLIKDQAWRNSSISSICRIERSDREASTSLRFDAGVFNPETLVRGVPLSDTTIGTANSTIGFNMTNSKDSVNPLLVGRFMSVEATVAGGFPLTHTLRRAIAASARSSADASANVTASAGASKPKSGVIPRELLSELAQWSVNAPFAQSGRQFNAQWRLPPDAAESSHHQTERALQFWRTSTTRDIGISFKASAPLAAAAPGGVLRISADFETSTNLPTWQENGWCPAHNLLEWSSYMRPLMFDAAGDKPLPFAQIAANMAAAPYELTKQFSRFNPTLLVPELFRKAVVLPDGPRNEFHRMLYDADGQRQRDWSMEASRFGPDSSTPLFGHPPADGVFTAIVAEARAWRPVHPGQLATLSSMSPQERMRYFLEHPRGQTELLRYIMLMELASKYTIAGRQHGRGYQLTVNPDLIAARPVVPPVGYEPSRFAAARQRLRTAVYSLGLTPENPHPREQAHNST